MGSISDPIIDIFLYYYHLSALHCIDIVRRNSVLVTNGISRVKGFFVCLIDIKMEYSLLRLILAENYRKKIVCCLCTLIDGDAGLCLL